jgi:SAM-dependent methyltransferase
MTTRHPARFASAVLDVAADFLIGCDRVLDSFAGTGRVHELPMETIGVEIEPEWAAWHPDTIVSDATRLPFAAETFDGVCSSPCYGNRLSDHHDAQDDSHRITYRHALGRPLHAANAGGMGWVGREGEWYRMLHSMAWREVWRVLGPGGVFVLNVKDHVRRGEVQRVSAWHRRAIEATGFELIAKRRLTLNGMRFGANAEARVRFENVFQFVRGF